MSGIFGRAERPKRATASKTNPARKVTCGQVMEKPRAIRSSVTMDRVLKALTSRNWDHIFLVDDEGVPVGRVHAVDVLKLIQRKAVNRDLVWMQIVEANQLITQPPMSLSPLSP